MQHKHRSNEQKTHNQYRNRANFEARWIFRVESPHPPSASWGRPACAPCSTAGVFPLPDRGTRRPGGHCFTGRASWWAHVSATGGRTRHAGNWRVTGGWSRWSKSGGASKCLAAGETGSGPAPRPAGRVLADSQDAWVVPLHACRNFAAGGLVSCYVRSTNLPSPDCESQLTS